MGQSPKLHAIMKGAFLLSRVLCLLSFMPCAFSPAFAAGQYLPTSNVPNLDWARLESSSDLVWHKCDSPTAPSDSKQHVFPLPASNPARTPYCARLSLPLDYHNASNPHNVSMALLKLSVPTIPSKRGTIIALPGGAGESRIKILLTMSNIGVLDALDPDYEYDFLTFENRGVAYSWPSARCSESVLGGKLWEGRLNDLSGVISTGGDRKALNVRLAGAQARGRLCANANTSEDGDIRKHMSTAYAARDMLEILNRLGNPLGKRFDPSSAQSQQHQHPKLQFMGISYGTVVGLTFASLYPQHVSRMLLDATADPNDWVARWQMSLNVDADAVWSTFFTDCYAANTSCPLWRAQESGAEGIQRRFDTWLEGLRIKPDYTVSKGIARMITYHDVRAAMVWANYSPSWAFPALAKMIDELMRGYTNVTLTFPFGDGFDAPVCPGQEDEDLRADSNAGAGTALNCGDAEDISDVSLDEFEKYLSALEEQSSIGAFFQGERKLRCLGWPSSLRPKWRFTGPFTSAADGSNSSVRILFLGNTLDPATPIRNAHKMAKKFPGSVVVEQNVRGHAALVNTVTCPPALSLLREYFRTGILPAPGTFFDLECNVFDGSCLKWEIDSARVIARSS